MSQPTSPSKDPAYGWIIVALAAIAMIATLPGRTHGLGMITERLLNDKTLGLDRQSFATINLWATLIGASFCIPTGWMLDRMGLRFTSTLVVASLGAVCLLMTRATGFIQFAILIMLTRGLGQSALSVVSISMTGKWFKSQLAIATGVYSFLVSVGFSIAFKSASLYAEADWRSLWSVEGCILLFLCATLFAVLIPSKSPADEIKSSAMGLGESDFTFQEALRTPAFWLFGLATSLFGLVSSGTSLFMESLLVERGFPSDTFYEIMAYSTLIGLASNLVTGWLMTRISISLALTIAMSFLTSGLLRFPFVETYPQLIEYTVLMGCGGGMITVLFFTVWAKLYGRSHLGRIQSIAQMLTVFASAVGPKILADVKVNTGSYHSAIMGLGVLTGVFAIAAALVPLPKKNPVQNLGQLESIAVT